MARYGTLDQPVSGEAIQSEVLAITGRRSEQQREIALRARLRKSFLKGSDQFLRRATAYKARAGDGVAVANNGDGVGG
jgi:hypothetical protein